MSSGHEYFRGSNTLKKNSTNKSEVFSEITKKTGYSIKATYILVLISKWFVMLHLPYFIFWTIHYLYSNKELIHSFTSQDSYINTQNISFYDIENMEFDPEDIEFLLLANDSFQTIFIRSLVNISEIFLIKLCYKHSYLFN